MTNKKILAGFLALALIIGSIMYFRGPGAATAGAPGKGEGKVAQGNAAAAAKPARPTNKDVPPVPAIGKKKSGSTGQPQAVEDPASVLTAHAKGDGDAWQSADDDLLVTWAANDPDAAMRWVDGGERSVVRAQLLAAVAAGILIRDGLDAMRAFLDKHQEDPGLRPKDQGELDKYLFFHLGREDTFPAAMEILREKKDPTLAGYMILGIEDTHDKIKAIDHLVANVIPVETDYHPYQAVFGKDPQLWADWAEQKKPDFLEEIIDAWRRDNPAEAKAWLDQKIPASDPRRAALDEVLSR